MALAVTDFAAQKQGTIDPKQKTDLQRVRAWLSEAESAFQEEREKIEEDFEFYFGQQWDEAIIAELKKQKKPYLTINLIFRQVNLLLGEERSSRTEPRAVPKGSAPEEALSADDMSKLLKHVYTTQNDGEYVMSEVFQDGVIGGLGWISVPISYETDPIDGTIRVERVDWRDLWVDPRSSQYDLSDARYLFRRYQLDLDDVLDLYPEKETEIRQALESMRMKPESSTQTKAIVHDVNLGDLYLDAKDASIAYDAERGQVRLYECWYREYDTVTFLVDRQDGEILPVETEGLALAESLVGEAPERFQTFRRRVKVMRVMAFLPLTQTDLSSGATTYTLADGRHDPDFPYVRFAAYWVDRRTFGVTRQLKDPQREKNKRRSQMLHFLGTAFRSGLDYEEGALADGVNQQMLEESFNRDGSVQKWEKGAISGGRFRYREPGQGIPPALFRLDAESEQELKDISGINADALGERGGDAGTSGVAVLRRQMQAQKVSVPIFDNWSRTKKLVGQLLVRRIQQVFTAPQVIQVTGRDGQLEAVSINQPQVDPITRAERLLNAVGLAQYDIVVTEAPSNPTLRMANVALLRELQTAYQEAGVPFPIGTIIGESDLPFAIKEELRRALPPQLGGQAPSPEQAAVIGAGPPVIPGIVRPPGTRPPGP